MKHVKLGIPIGQFITAALAARGWSDSAAGKVLGVPSSLIPALRKGLVELRESSIQAVENEFGESWSTWVVSTLGKPNRLTADTLGVLRALESVTPVNRTRAQRAPRVRARAA